MVIIKLLNETQARENFTMKEGDTVFISSKIKHIEQKCCKCGFIHNWKIRINKDGITLQ